MEEKIINLFKENSGILTIQKLNDNDISYSTIRKLKNDALIETIKRGIYKLVDADIDDFIETQKLIPNGVFCLYSSAAIHELTTFVPMEHHIAIHKKRKISLPEYPPIQLYYWDTTSYELGIEKVNKNGNLIDVYNAEKTVCDFLRFRNKLGMEAAKEVLKTYLSSRERDISKLVDYSRELRIYAKVNQYLEILL